MTTQLQDFVSTYRRPPMPEPFAGYFKENKYTQKRKFKKADREPQYIRVHNLIKAGYSLKTIAVKLDITLQSVKDSVKYSNNK